MLKKEEYFTVRTLKYIVTLIEKNVYFRLLEKSRFYYFFKKFILMYIKTLN